MDRVSLASLGKKFQRKVAEGKKEGRFDWVRESCREKFEGWKDLRLYKGEGSKGGRLAGKSISLHVNLQKKD